MFYENKNPSFARLAAVLVPLFLLSACAVPWGADIDAPMDIDAKTPYVLHPGDEIKIVVAGEKDLSGNFMIDGAGKITVPMVGSVEAAGYSKADLQKNIREQFEYEGFLRRPLITVDTSQVRPFAIIGEVKMPGNYDYRPMQTVFQAISTAGGYTQRAAKNRILIDRWVDGQLVRMNANQNTPILPGDAITVRERIF